MKITFLTAAADMSGGSKIIAEHAKRLMNKGHHVTIVVKKKSRPSTLKNLRQMFLSKPEISIPNRSHYYESGINVKFSESSQCITAHDVPDADVVVATWWETVEWAMKFPRAKGARAYFVQGHEIFDYMPIERVRATYRAAFHKIVVSEWLKKTMLEVYGDTDVDVACNAVDHTLFDSPERGKQVCPTVGFTYSRTSLKRIDLILLALQSLIKEFPNLKVFSFGEKPFSDAEKSSLPIRHCIRPSQRDIPYIYSGCDVWVTATNNEGFGLPAMEAMACRTPVVASRSGWPADVIQDGLNGFLANIDDVAGLVQGLGNVLRSDEATWRDMSYKAYLTAHRHSLDFSSDALEAALRRALGRDLR